jgi:hypothetical protein
MKMRVMVLVRRRKTLRSMTDEIPCRVVGFIQHVAGSNTLIPVIWWDRLSIKFTRIVRSTPSPSLNAVNSTP